MTVNVIFVAVAIFSVIEARRLSDLQASSVIRCFVKFN